MTTEEVIQNHLSEIQLVGYRYRFSAFRAALRDARLATNRNLDTGEKLADKPDHGSWLGALGYMALLDQIGSCFKPTDAGKQDHKVAAIIKALKYFSNIQDEAECQAIYALRCSFAHDFALINIPPNKDYILRFHRFSVTQSGEGSVVILPPERWDGDLSNKSDRNLTNINLEKLGDLVEDVCRKIIVLATLNQLEIVLKGGSNELSRRYSLIVGP